MNDKCHFSENKGLLFTNNQGLLTNKCRFLILVDYRVTTPHPSLKSLGKPLQKGAERQ